MSRAQARASALAVGLLLAAMPASGEDARDRGPDTVDVSGFPDEMKTAYDTFATRCSKCHSLARPINTRAEDPDFWKRYIRKMMRKPGSGINRASGKTIYQFLVFLMEEREKEKGAGEKGEE